MTEAEWLASLSPWRMLEHLHTAKASDRKLRLFACACCRMFWDRLVDSRSRQAVELAERFADGLAGQKELHAAWDAARSASEAVARQIDPGRPFDAARAAALVCHVPVIGDDRMELLLYGAGFVCVGPGLAGPTDGLTAQVGLLRDIFGNPFRPVRFPPAWRTPASVDLATAAYDERELPSGRLDPARLAVLADALEEAGCDDADVLSHCRGPGPHVRGCWVVDSCIRSAPQLSWRSS